MEEREEERYQSKRQCLVESIYSRVHQSFEEEMMEEGM